MALAHPFRIGMTADFFDDQGLVKYADIGLDLLDGEPQITLSKLETHYPEIDADQLTSLHSLIVLTPRVTRQSLAKSDHFLAIGRFGVGYDSVDVDACTDANVMLFITEGAVDHSVAEATVGWMLALTHHLPIKDRLVRSGDWHARSQYMGSELRDRTLGVIGFGGIGRAVVRMLSGFRMATPLIYDPFVPESMIEAAGGRRVSLDELLAQADFVSLHCPLLDSTRNLISARELNLMKSTAWLINTARGGIVNEADLYHALRTRRIAGAALDCFDKEPLLSPPSFAELDNVILAPHSIAWTHELFRDIGQAVVTGMIDLAYGRPPRGIVNRQVLERPGFQAKWKRTVLTPSP